MAGDAAHGNGHTWMKGSGTSQIPDASGALFRLPLAGPEGFEPPSCSFGDCCFAALNYDPKIGRGGRIATSSISGITARALSILATPRWWAEVESNHRGRLDIRFTVGPRPLRDYLPE